MLGAPDSGHCTPGVQGNPVGQSDREGQLGGTHELIEKVRGA